MIFYITLVASQKPLTIGHLAETEMLLQNQGLALAGKPLWLAPHKAADIGFAGKPNSAQVRELRAIFYEDAIDVFVTSKVGRRKKLLMADMDATIVKGETLDELADFAGLKEQISEITARAMNGELDFKEALRERVSLLKDLPENALQETLEKTELNPGAKIFVRAMKRNGATCVLVSGGFSFFTGAIATRAGFDHHHGNILCVEGGALTGAVLEPILDKDSKLQFLHRYMDDLNINPDDVLAIGDGANDLPMLESAGLGVGYHPKPVLVDALDNCIVHGDLTAALFAQGYSNPTS